MRPSLTALRRDNMGYGALAANTCSTWSRAATVGSSSSRPALVVRDSTATPAAADPAPRVLSRSQFE